MIIIKKILFIFLHGLKNLFQKICFTDVWERNAYNNFVQNEYNPNKWDYTGTINNQIASNDINAINNVNKKSSPVSLGLYFCFYSLFLLALASVQQQQHSLLYPIHFLKNTYYFIIRNLLIRAFNFPI